MSLHLRSRIKFGLNGVDVRKFNTFCLNKILLLNTKMVVGISHYFYSL